MYMDSLLSVIEFNVSVLRLAEYRHKVFYANNFYGIQNLMKHEKRLKTLPEIRLNDELFLNKEFFLHCLLVKVRLISLFESIVK